MLQFVVESDIELLDFLNKVINKKESKKYLVHKSVLVNNRIITQYNYLLKKNDVVKINIYNKASDIDIIYEDENIIVVNKKEGILSVADDSMEVTMYNLVSDYVKKKNKKNKIFVIHRLDKETSGVLMFAKNEKIKNLYQTNWDSLVIKREYIAIVNGIIDDSGTIKNYLYEDKNHFVHSGNRGKLAITNYQKIKSDNKYSWVLVDIQTGRKNQIRVHFKELGYPIVGDTKYYKKNDKYKRLCLHASRLIIKNPLNMQIMEFSAVIPDIFY